MTSALERGGGRRKVDLQRGWHKFYRKISFKCGHGQKGVKRYSADIIYGWPQRVNTDQVAEVDFDLGVAPRCTSAVVEAAQTESDREGSAVQSNNQI